MTEQNVSPVSAEELKRLAEEAGFDTFSKGILFEDFDCTEEVANLVELVRSESVPAASGATPEGFVSVPQERMDELLYSADMLMRWCVANVNKWNFPEYDQVDRSITKMRESLAAAPLPPDPNAGPEPSGTSPDFGY